MFQIKNNIVYLTRGEDAVYTRSIRRADKYYSPYVLTNGLKNPKIRMTIKANKNDKEPLLNYEGFIGSEIPKFDSQVILNVNPPLPTQDIKNQVYRITLRNAVTDKPEYTYHYYKTTPDMVGVIDETKTSYSVDWLKTVGGVTIVPKENFLYAVDDTLYIWDGEKYYEATGLWETYELLIRIPISSEDTVNLTPGTYYYDIALITRDDNDNIDYSNTWLTPTEFIIGGSYGN